MDIAKRHFLLPTFIVFDGKLVLERRHFLAFVALEIKVLH